jgi:hypothetical protein
LSIPAWLGGIVELGDNPLALSPSGFASLIADEIEKRSNVVRLASIKEE